MSAAPLRLVVVPHTHWDREWYRTHEQFRYRLVSLVDELLDLLERDPTFRHFMLDGQTIVVDDYLEVRPRARARIEKLVRDGRLAIGPWHVLPDEWLVSGEALLRNLRVGLAKARALGAGMRVGYVPDQFGHIGQLPQIFAGFGFPAAVLWRGVGADVDRTLFEWEAPDGTRLPTVYLMHGYGNAVNLPMEPVALAARLGGEARALGRRSDVSTLLCMNGSDHERPQLDLPRVLAAAQAVADGAWSAEIGSLTEFVTSALAEAPAASLPVHRGELRSGLRSPLLPGCASARAPQKRREFENDRLLTRYLEPLAAWLAALGGDADPERIEFAWRVALENHPHDSVCGCSIDAVHAQMETRFDRVAEIAGTHLEVVTNALAAHVDPGPGEGAAIAVWNPNAGGRLGVDTEMEVEVPIDAAGAPRPFHLRRTDGLAVAVASELLRPAGARHAGVFERHGVLALLPGLRREFESLFANGIELDRRGDRLHARIRLGETPDARFDLDAARGEVTEVLRDEAIHDVAVETWLPPRVRLRFADDLPGHGLRVYRFARGAGPIPAALRTERSPDGVAIENEHWRIEADASGRVALEARSAGLRIEDAVRFVSEGDRGDEYNFDPVPGSEQVERLERVRMRSQRRGAEAVLRIEGVLRVPRGLTASRAERSARTVRVPVSLELRLGADLDRVDLALRVDNTACDHRLRVHLRAPFAAHRFEVESAFEVAVRPIAPAADSFGSSQPSETPIGAGPQRSFATLLGDGDLALTVANRGAAEVEAVRERDGTGALAVTLLRAVGWLSRPDLALRRGPAGPALATPGAQVPGSHTAELSLRLHPARDPRRVAEAHGFAYPPLGFRCGAAKRGSLLDGDRLVAIDDPAVIVSAIEPRPGGDAELRLWNAEAQEHHARVAWTPPCAGILPIDLDGRPGRAEWSESAAGVGTLRVGPCQIVALRVQAAAQAEP